MAPSKKNHKKEESVVNGKEVNDLAQELRNLQTEQEELKSEIEIKKAKISLWRDIMKAETGTEIEEIISSSPFENLAPVTTERHEMITRFSDLDAILHMHKRSGIIAKSTPDGDTLVQFLPSKKTNFPEDLLLKLSQNKEDNTFSVVDHNLQDFVPIDELVEDYLSGPAANVKTFISQVALYTTQLIKRHTMFEHIRQNMITNIHYNSDRTKLSIDLCLEQNKKDETRFELTLYYDPLNLVPDKVNSNYYDGAKPDNQINDLVNTLVAQLCEGPVNAVLWSNIFEDSGNAQESTDTIEGTKFSNILGEV